VAINSAAPEASTSKETLAARIALFEAIRKAIDREARRGSTPP
jgi:hypothetical protein